jgi:dihydroxyacetone kinase-like protein
MTIPEDSVELRRALIQGVARRVIDHADELTDLDRAIGDGDHGINMKRGCEALLAKLDELAEKPLPEALKAGGMALVMSVGGASGPLYGTLFMSLGKALPTDAGAGDFSTALGEAVAAVKARGKSEAGQKTLLDVLVPLVDQIDAGDWDLAGVRARTAESAAATVPMLATRGRASFLGERSVGHMDPGARSSQLMIEAVCDVLEGRK